MRRAGRLAKGAAGAGSQGGHLTGAQVSSDLDSEADGESFSPLFTYLLLFRFCGAQPSPPWEGLQGEVVDERQSFL